MNRIEGIKVNKCDTFSFIFKRVDQKQKRDVEDNERKQRKEKKYRDDTEKNTEKNTEEKNEADKQNILLLFPIPLVSRFVM